MTSRALPALILGALAAFVLSQTAFSTPGAPRQYAPRPDGGAARGEAADTAPASSPAIGARPARQRFSGSRLAAVRRAGVLRSYLVARVRAGRALAVRTRPGGPVDTKLGDRTEFGSPRALGVARARGRWLGLTTSARPNGRLGWVSRRSAALRLARVRWSLHADLSRRTLELRRGSRVVRRLSVAVGRPGSSTPTGRFAVTDKLSGGRFGSYYGCCILALSGYQPRPPAGWRGGNRLAIHGTSAPGTIGTAASAGCLRAGDSDLRVLMRRVPLGTPVFVRR
jgi:hypothetical protein